MKNENSIDFKEESIYDLLYDLNFQLKLSQSQDDIRNGRVMTIEESKERMRQKYANFNVT